MIELAGVVERIKVQQLAAGAMGTDCESDEKRQQGGRRRAEAVQADLMIDNGSHKMLHAILQSHFRTESLGGTPSRNGGIRGRRGAPTPPKRK